MTDTNAATDARPGPPREWTPRIWQGCAFPAWARLLTRNGAKLDPSLSYIGGVVTSVSLCHSLLTRVHDAVFGDAPAHAPIDPEPIFVVGHWRTGTTLLHELLALDPRHTSPTTLQCLAPHHFLLTEPLFRRFGNWMLPSHRPMDNMAVGWDRPQEDEFALCLLGAVSPYQGIAFPNNPPPPESALTLEGLPSRELRRWKEIFVGFLRRVTYRDPRRLVLKSPTHSCRIPTILELFPRAKFVHIVRDPFVVYPSTVNLWKSLQETHGLQKPRFEGLEERVLSTFSLLYQRLDAGSHLIPEGNYVELRYEDLVADPVAEMTRVYGSLRLGGFDAVKGTIDAYWRDRAGYETNRYRPLPEATRETISRRWKTVIDRYGYRPQAAEERRRTAG